MQVLNLDAELNISRLDADIRTLRLGEGGTTNYNDLTNKPSINSVTLTGNKTTSDLNIKTSDLINDEGFITNADIPTKTSDLINDSGFQTAAQVSSAVAAAIPTNVSAFTNDAGYITAAQVGNIPTKTSDLTNDSGFITSAEAPVQSVNGYTGAVNLVASDIEVSAGVSVADGLSDLALNMPTKTSDLVNDSGFITSLNVPSKTSDLVNDSGFITSADIPTDVSAFTNDAGYQTAADVNTLIQAVMPVTETIENESIASFSDGADNVPVSELIVDIDADAGGFSSVNVVMCGKNLLPNEITTATERDITFTTQDNGKIYIYGTSTGSIYQTDICEDLSLPEGNYIFSYDAVQNVNIQICDRAENIQYYIIDSSHPSINVTVTSEMSNNMKVRFIIQNGRTVDGTTGVMIRLASETDTAFEPYNGTTYIIALGETLTQGGVLNVTTGLLTRNDTTTAQLTPTEVRTLLEDNNIFADTGDVNKLVYFKTGCEAIARLIEAYK